MGIFLDTIGNATLSIAVCDRCKMKRAKDQMRSDPNFPGLQVCDQGCADEKDPYRLPARKTERITLQFPRPDVSVAVDPNDILTQPYGGAVLSTEQSGETPAQDGNQQIIGTQP